MVVYLDVLFAVNVLMDGVSLFAAAALGGVRVGRVRLLLASVLGGGYAVLAAVVPLLAALPLRVVVGVGLCAVAFGGKPAFGRVCALYFVVAASFVGLAMALGAVTGRTLLFGAGYYIAVPFRFLLLAAAAGYAFSGILLRGDALHGPLRREVERLTICFDGREREVRLLHDTGNGLVEPISGRPVLVLGREAVDCLLGKEIRDACMGKKDAAACLGALPPETASRFGLLPYRAVGVDSGLLLYFRPDKVQRADGTALDCVCAIGPDSIGQGAYDGLIGV
ncbi:sigma-E processing peptidase SpoIIGA [uncultured Agathobaculum sp.]|uniref:sigma-E processing peptidase SpoIIGA n=1 Tax=uncultured Agathobaculum sp. TaxID=2048140 RepID=UPI003209DA24